MNVPDPGRPASTVVPVLAFLYARFVFDPAVGTAVVVSRTSPLGRLVDILPALNGEDSPKGSSRLRASSVVKYAFASHVEGRRPIVTEGVRYSACSRVNAAFRPGHAGRFHGTCTVRPSTAGYSARTVPRVASAELVGRGLGSNLLPRGTWTRSVRPSEAGASRRGNSGRLPYESEWHEDVGFIPALKRGAFSSNLRNVPAGGVRQPPPRGGRTLTTLPSASGGRPSRRGRSERPPCRRRTRDRRSASRSGRRGSGPRARRPRSDPCRRARRPPRDCE